MTSAAGIMFATRDGRALFLKRSMTGDHGYEWCFPGGTLEDGEQPEDAARREAREECGWVPDNLRLVELCRSRSVVPVVARLDDAGWNESEHPRAEDGRFGDKAGSHEGKVEG